MAASNYDKHPIVSAAGKAWQGWPAILAEIRERLDRHDDGVSIVVVECYPGVSASDVRDAFAMLDPNIMSVDPATALLPESEIGALVAPFDGGDDPLFGYMSNLSLEAFFCARKLADLREQVSGATGTVLIVGTGAALVASNVSLLIYADLPRWEIQRRQRAGEMANLGSADTSRRASLLYKRAFFVDWRVCDRLKKTLLPRCDYLLDTTVREEPRLVGGDDFRGALSHCATRPFRVVPFFDPGPWGGQWMRRICDLDPGPANFAWCFDCVPEENSLLLSFDGVTVEVPSIDLVFAEPRALLGEPVYGRFGAEFPIRFDLLDTMDGGNLSLQVHPLTEYIQAEFGVPYTQDESYYLLDAAPGASVFLGRRRDADFDDMIQALNAAQRGGEPFEAEDFVARFPAKAHDHFLIPAGTLHCSGRDAMVLEISATPYIFTFKLWDWGRLGLDGQPRPINVDRGAANIRWERDEDYAGRHLVNQVSEVARGDGWREERTGLHQAEFIETRRHWFTGPVEHDTGGVMTGGVNVLNLVAGAEAVVESPSGAFAPFVVHYAETFIVPAAVGRYRIRPHGPAEGTECATIKAFVRTGA